MEEKDAIELLGKLKTFMENTNKSIETLNNRVHNINIDLEKVKQYLIRIKKEEKRIIFPN